MRWRWGAVGVLLASLVALPNVLADRPVHAVRVEPQALLAAIRGSAPIPWSGYGESRGAVGLPDVKQLGDLAGILGTTTRYRVWWHDQTVHRVDALSLTGEKDTAADDSGSWHWSSDAGLAVRVVGTQPVRLPDAADLIAPSLGRRLAGTRDVLLSVLAGRRVAGRDVPGVRLTPAHPAATTIAHVDLYADPDTGLVLEADVQAIDQRVPVLRSVLLSVTLRRPSATLSTFEPGDNAVVVSGKDLAEQVDERSPYVLPDTVGGLPVTSLLGSVQGLQTYGEGFGQVVLLPLARGQGRDLARSVRKLGGRFDTALVHGLLVENDFRRRYLVVGTVPPATLDAMGQDLLTHPPPEQ